MWCHLVAKFATNSNCITCWPDLEPVLVASPGGQILTNTSAKNEYKFNIVEKITQVLNSIPWVRCASGNVWFYVLPGDDDNEDRDDDVEKEDAQRGDEGTVRMRRWWEDAEMRMTRRRRREDDAQRGDEGSALWGLDAASRGEYSIGFRSFQRKTALPGSHLHGGSTSTYQKGPKSRP